MRINDRKPVCPHCKKEIDATKVDARIIKANKAVALIRSFKGVRHFRFVCIECLKERGEYKE